MLRVVVIENTRRVVKRKQAELALWALARGRSFGPEGRAPKSQTVGTTIEKDSTPSPRRLILFRDRPTDKLWNAATNTGASSTA